MPARDFESIYADCSRLVYWTAYGVLKSQADAMDVSQNVFLRVLKHIKKLEDMNDAQLKGWVYRVTVNACFDLKRKQKREVVTDEGFDTLPVSERELPEAAALSAEQKRLLREAIDALPDIYRETVVLHYFSGLSYENIAAYTGVSEGTVKSRMSRAKDRLFSLLKDGELNG
ncbi:MAG: RNA polymerase sigma factor [Clostridiaceae bacterium]|nr:RNA polymerase sigma factor [Eubacteriales bacterium]